MNERADQALAERLERLAGHDVEGDWADVRRRAELAASGRRRSRRGRLVAIVAALLAVAVAAPALGLHEPILRFFEGEPAPEQIVKGFATLDDGAPIPEWRTGVIAGETRKVMEAYFADKLHTLFVAPTKYGGLCEQWSRAGGGCDRLGTVPLSISWGRSGSIPAGSDGLPDLDKYPPDYIEGFAHSKWVDRVEIRFEDGAVVRPDVVWVGAPIDAGFFAYDVPREHLRLGHRISAVVALDVDGNLVTEDTGGSEGVLPVPPVDALVDAKEKSLEIPTANGSATIWTAPTRYEGRCLWLDLEGKLSSLGRCSPKGYEHDGGIATRFLPTRDDALLFASVSPRVGLVVLRFAGGENATVEPHDGLVLYEIPAAHFTEGQRLAEVVFKDRSGAEITRFPVTTGGGPRAACYAPVPLPAGVDCK